MCYPTFSLRRTKGRGQDDTVATAAGIHGVCFALSYWEIGVFFLLSQVHQNEKTNTLHHTQGLLISLFQSLPVGNLGEGSFLVSLTDACNIWKFSSTPTDSPGMQTADILQQGV